jgi:hypothetical protein
MSQRAGSRARGFLSRGALLSLLLHVHMLGSIGAVIWFFAGREQAAREAQRAQEMDVEFQDATAAELPKDLPPIDAPPDQVEPPKPQPKQKPIARDKTPEEKIAKPEQEKPKPKEEEKKIAQPAPKPEQPPPPPPDLAPAHEKIVDQESAKNEPPPPDAKYLAQDNHHAAEQKRARDTTLEKRKHDDKENALPTAEKDKIAELEEQKSALGRKAPDVTPHENPQVAEAQERKNEPKSLLALRDPAPRTHEITPETADPSLPKAADGDIAMSRAARGKPADPARLKAGEKVRLALSQKDFEYLFGADAALDPEREARAEDGARAGRARELRARGPAGKHDRAEHARGAVRRVHRAHAPEHPQALGLRSAGGVGRADGIEPAQRSEARDDAGGGHQPRRDDRQGDDRADVRLSGFRRRRDRRALHGRSVPRSAA